MNTSSAPAADTAIDEIRQRLSLCLPHLIQPWGDHEPLERLGLDSMDTVEFLCTIHEEFGVRLAEEDFRPTQTWRGLLEAIARSLS